MSKSTQIGHNRLCALSHGKTLRNKPGLKSFRKITFPQILKTIVCISSYPNSKHVQRQAIYVKFIIHNNFSTNSEYSDLRNSSFLRLVLRTHRIRIRIHKWPDPHFSDPWIRRIRTCKLNHVHSLLHAFHFPADRA